MNYAKIFMGTLMLGLGLAAPASAAERTYTPTAVGCFDSAICYVTLSTSVPGTDTSCATKNQVRWYVNTDQGKLMYQTALSSFLAGRTLRMDFGYSNCLGGYPVPWYLQAHN